MSWPLIYISTEWQSVNQNKTINISLAKNLNSCSLQSKNLLFISNSNLKRRQIVSSFDHWKVKHNETKSQCERLVILFTWRNSDCEFPHFTTPLREESVERLISPERTIYPSPLTDRILNLVITWISVPPVV